MGPNFYVGPFFSRPLYMGDARGTTAIKIYKPKLQVLLIYDKSLYNKMFKNVLILIN